MPETPRPRPLPMILKLVLAETATDKAGAAMELDGSSIRRWRIGTCAPTPAKLAALLDVCDAPAELQREAWMALGVPAHVLVSP